MAEPNLLANVLTSAELKRRGIVAIEQALQRGQVHLLKRNQPAAVVLSEQHYRQLQRQADQAASPETSALEWLLMQPQASQPRSKASIDAELAAVIAFLDASALIYLLEGEPPWASSVKHELQALAAGPLRRGDQSSLERFDGFSLVAICCGKSSACTVP